MIQLKPTDASELALLFDMERAVGTRELIIPSSTEAHRAQMDDPMFKYLSIVDGEVALGFLILCLDADGRSVEFRRIVVATKNAGTGQRAIQLMEAYCGRALQRSRVWLDVFPSNTVARHIYEKLGYVQFGERHVEGRMLLLFDKVI
jgi:RimJ/RimL family protein N-acetyltransferase